jgi:D-alanine transaminase
MPEIAWLNGSFMPLRKARVSVMDRGFLFGDGVYEVLHAHDGVPLLLNEHLRRLVGSARALSLKIPSMKLLRQVIAQGISKAGYARTFVYIQVTRGVEFPRSHVPDRRTKPTVLVAFWPLKLQPESNFQEGVAAVTAPDLRWRRCDIKSVNLLANCMGKTDAAGQGAAEVIYIDQGKLVEGASNAVFIVKRGRIRVPHLGRNILASLTRAQVIAAAGRLGIPVTEGVVTIKQLRSADEIFLASTSCEGLPVIRLDGKKVGSGRPGQVALDIHREVTGAREAKIRRRRK